MNSDQGGQGKDMSWVRSHLRSLFPVSQDGCSPPLLEIYPPVFLEQDGLGMGVRPVEGLQLPEKRDTTSF